MATIAPARVPFAALDSPRLQSLQSAKNRQNAITASIASEKATLSPSSKRSCPSPFEDDLDSENIDPSIFNSPSKRSKGFDGTPKKASRFTLTTVTSSARAAPSLPSPFVPASRNAISSPSSSTTTPISQSRGSPKHKRVGLLNRRKTSGGSPFHRVDPPSFGRKSTSSLPFSLDAALSGTISSYSPKTVVEPKAPVLEESMPKSWFFDIHEDTPEEEATNMMEHSACILDISSDDDCETKLFNEAKERGKENIPPPDFLASLAASNSARMVADSSSAPEELDAQPIKMSAREKFAALDAMAEDRNPLKDLPASDYYAPGLDASSCVVVDASAPSKPSGLSKEVKSFDFEVPVPQSEPVEEEEKNITIWEDNTIAKAPVVEEAASVASDANVPEDSVVLPLEDPTPEPSAGKDILMV